MGKTFNKEQRKSNKYSERELRREFKSNNHYDFSEEKPKSKEKPKIRWKPHSETGIED